MFSMRYARPTFEASAIKIICHGNSHTEGEGSSSTSTRWTGMMQTHLPLSGKSIPVVNTGIGGQSITAMIGNAATAVDAHLASGVLNILFAQEFGNELSANGRDVGAAWTKWITYCNARRAAAEAANKKLWIITVGMHPSGAAATQELRDARVQSTMAVNDLLRRRFREHSDQFIDLGASEPFKTLYEGGVWTSATFNEAAVYQRSDGTADDMVHMGNAGHAVLGALAARALLRVRRV